MLIVVWLAMEENSVAEVDATEKRELQALENESIEDDRLRAFGVGEDGDFSGMACSGMASSRMVSGLATGEVDE